jgi:hypothetical protein
LHKLLFKDKIYIYLLIKEITLAKVDNLLLMNQTCTWLLCWFFASKSNFIGESSLRFFIAAVLIEGENDEFKMELFQRWRRNLSRLDGIPCLIKQEKETVVELCVFFCLVWLSF